MKKYDLVIKNCSSSGKYFDDEYAFVNGKHLSGIRNIDKYTSAFTIDELYNNTSFDGCLDKFHSLMIRVVDGADISYQDIIVNNKVINSCVKDVNEVGIINKENKLFQKEVEELIFFINQYNLKIIKDGLIDKTNNELFSSIVRYKKNKNNESLFLKLVDDFSDYLNFRKWILNKEQIRKNGVYDNYVKECSEKNEFIRKFNTEGGEFIFDNTREEFLVEDELIDMKVGVKAKRL